MPDAELLEKLKKIKALADEAQDDHECQTAMMMFQRLLTKNGLDVAEVEAMPDTRAERPEETDVYTGQRLPKWLLYLHSTIADHFRCIAAISYRGGRQTLQFVGHPCDAAIAVEAFETAISAADRLYGRYRLHRLEEEALGEWNRAAPKLNKSRYLLGFAMGLQTAYRQQEAEATFDIILTTPPDVQEYVKDYGHRKWSVSRQAADENTSAGYADGFNVGCGDRLTEQA